MVNFLNLIKQVVSVTGRTLFLVICLGISAVMVFMLTDNNKQSYSTNNKSSEWGSEALSEVYDGLSTLSPISLANACGLGASSCFKCHNGKRAEAPKTSPTDGPWHAQHSRVNNSCTGCHKGNPRLMKEKMAHSRLLTDVLNNTDKACSKCHSGSELEDLIKTYTAVGGNN
jgi:nitrate/TMAO reductase-like tetraheme cytochrome c subunit